MIYIDSKPNLSGAYANAKRQPFPGCIPLTDAQAAVFFEHNGFVFLTEDGEITPNLAAWETWKAEQNTADPEDPQPTTEERVTTLEETTAQQGEILQILLSGETGESA